jgi:HemY protein
MARIEGGEKRDAGRVREWLARAVRAPRDATWIADGVTSDEWAPISPVTGALDAFEWRVPVDRSRTGPDDALMDEVSALSRELENVARVEEGIEAEAKASGSGQPITITVKAVETVPPAEPAKTAATKEEVVPDTKGTPAEKQTAPSTAGTGEQPSSTAAKGETKAQASGAAPATPDVAGTKVPRKIETRIFIPDRPPDDPGPDPAGDNDDTTTPIGRFRSASK